MVHSLINLIWNLQSQKRKQDLLAEMMLEEQRGRELSKIVREILPDSNNSAVEKKPPRARKVFFFFSEFLFPLLLFPA